MLKKKKRSASSFLFFYTVLCIGNEIKTLINCWNSLVVLEETLAPFHLLTFFLSCLCYSIARFYHQPSHLLGLDLKRNVGVSRCFFFFLFSIVWWLDWISFTKRRPNQQKFVIYMTLDFKNWTQFLSFMIHSTPVKNQAMKTWRLNRNRILVYTNKLGLTIQKHGELINLWQKKVANHCDQQI